MENSETSVWIDFAFECGYIDKERRDKFNEKAAEIGRLLNHMIENPENYRRN
jgi:four helix bundle protein